MLHQKLLSLSLADEFSTNEEIHDFLFEQTKEIKVFIKICYQTSAYSGDLNDSFDKEKCIFSILFSIFFITF